MDTNILTHPDINSENIVLSARLPGELGDIPPDNGVLNEHPAPAADGRLPTSQRTKLKRRGTLLAGVAAAAVAAVAAVGAGVFLLSPYNHVYPVPRLASTVRNAAASAGVKLPAVLAPSASLANVTLPSPPPATRDHYAAKPRQDEVAELLALHPAAKDHAGDAVPGASSAGQPEKAPAIQPPVPANPPTTTASAANADRSDVPAGYVPSEPGAVVPPVRPRDATAAVLAAIPSAGKTAAEPLPASPPLPAPAASTAAAAPVPPVLAASPPADPIAVAHDLRAAPMAAPDQVEVLGLVTEMASVVKRLREQNAELRADFGKSSADTASRLADHERRLALAEARSAVAAANNVGIPAPVEPVADPAPIVAKPVAITRAMAVLPAVTGPAAPKSYRVQAASPGLALLAEVERGGGEGAQMQVVVGDTIPDYGRVKSIAQKGTAWVVTTEHGQIQ
jgi:hypothetical protein